MNEKGITLVELLAALVLFGIIAVLIWKFFFQAIDFSDRAISKNQLQQEANLIVNTIQQLHTKSTILFITIVEPDIDKFGSKIEVGYSTKENPTKVKYEYFERGNIRYKINEPISSNPGNFFNFDISLKSEKKPSIYFDTKTTFSKLSAKPK
ncbi:prepilin-type N-terminal cleavage/methylation domain-containing protein [Psychrobacillus glaciei]|uniref:Prepilin-type N-terminal cleavage/methylation domain-containing protein n=2 Tax=Psychrobacillus glaciei TaxID=2283160 RepID=A0A5J6SNN2_9BACI|nr:prepilin-type N-terminal cleavage/methylation domain-containing protein [Psychrobacillus glaciei]